MRKIIPINLAVEDELSEIVCRKLLEVVPGDYAVGACYSQGGFGYLRNKIAGFNNAAKGTPFFVLTDLDTQVCAPALIAEWLAVPMHPNLIFRVAVKEIEAWLLADAEAFARFAGLSISLVPKSPDKIEDAKKTLIQLISKSPSRELRADIVPPADSSRVQGPDYNGRLCRFVWESWNPRKAARQSPSLASALARLRQFTPTWE